MSDVQTLGPCPNPFCYSHERDFPLFPIGVREVPICHGRIGFAVVCADCNLRGPTSGNREEATTAWNTRAHERPEPVPSAELVEVAAKAAYASWCTTDPVAPKEPDWGRGGYKTEVVVWQALARAVLAAVSPHLIDRGRREAERGIAKRLDEFRSELNNISRAAEDEGDRVYFGSTNDADDLRAVAERFEGMIIALEYAPDAIERGEAGERP